MHTVHAVDRRSFCRWLGTGLLVTLATPVLTGCESVDEFFTGERTIVDAAGRELVIPSVGHLERIYFTDPVGQVWCFTLAPDLLVGTSMQFTDEELAYLPEGTADLPYLGGFLGGAEIDREALLAEGVQVVFLVTGAEITEANVSEVERLQKQVNIPVVMVDGSFDNVSSAFRLLGEVLGKEERAEELVSYCEKVITEVTAAVATVPEDRHVKLYYAEGPEGLQTEPDVSEHALAFQIAGATNVATIEHIKGAGMSNVSLEQVLAWDPEVIIAWDDVVRGGAAEDIRTNPDWATLAAVKTGRVYTMPNIPYAWCDRPRGINRLIGIQWVANMLYPDAYDVDMVEEVKAFYSGFYRVDITDDEAKRFLGNSYPPYGT
ncbi:MAG: ABC transporter substrate-binding protein [Coriobacteriia bacterium]|nr:ABC transporter substrate-binding protein [Coriobacteriia bacterium]